MTRDLKKNWLNFCMINIKKYDRKCRLQALLIWIHHSHATTVLSYRISARSMSANLKTISKMIFLKYSTFVQKLLNLKNCEIYKKELL